MLTIQPLQTPPPLLTLCNGQLTLDVDFEPSDEDFDDNIFIRLNEDCPPEWKLLAHEGSSFGMTSGDARKLAQALLQAADQNDQWLAGKGHR
jgi:hypothetical protein